MKKAGWVLTGLVLLGSAAAAGTGEAGTVYVGGTLPIKQGTAGTSSISDENDFVFDYQGGRLEIPYTRVNAIEYGQMAGGGMSLAKLSPVSWFGKKRQNFLTVNYLDDTDRQQAAVFELGKGLVRSTLTHMEARTGKRVEYEDAEARKSVMGAQASAGGEKRSGVARTSSPGPRLPIGQ